MNRSRVLFFILSVAIVVPLLSSTLLGAPAVEDEGETDSFYKYLSVFTEVLKLVRQVYVEETDVETLMAGALDGASDALDPFSTYIPADGVKPFKQALSVGTGHSGLLLLKERGVAYAVAVTEGSPAEAAGIEQGDIVSEIDGRSSRAMPLWQIQALLAKKPGTEVKLELLRRGTTLEKTLVLDRFEPPPPRLREMQGVPVLRVPSFSEATPGKVEELMKQVSADKLLIDLRGVAGGDVEAAYRVARRFASGPLGALVAREGEVETWEGSDVGTWKGDLVVLIDRSTLGAAEVLARILQQSAGAKLVGERSFGYAGRSQLVKLSSGAHLQITDAFYTGPDGEPLMEGLEPDVQVDRRFRFTSDSSESQDPEDEGEDRFLEEGLKILLEEEGLEREVA